MSGGSRLLDQVRDIIRIKHYSIRTEQAYLQWIRRYILFHGKRHPSELGSEHLSTFLSHLAMRGNVAASTQNQALNAILFLYREVLKQKLPWVEGVQRAKRPQHLPVVLSRDEIKHVLAQLEGTVWLMAALTYGGGLRLLECLRLRVKDLDFDRAEVMIRDGKGQKDRVTMLPRTLLEPLRTHLSRVHLLHERDLDVIAGQQQVCCKRVSECVHAGRFHDAGAAHCPLDRTLQHIGARVMPALDMPAGIEGSAGRREDVLPAPLAISVRILAIEREREVHATIALCQVALVEQVDATQMCA